MKIRITLTLVLFVLGSIGLCQAQSVESTPAYQVHVKDQLVIDVAGDPTLSKTTTVLDDGSITYPLLGRMLVRGLSLQQVGSLFAQRLQQYIRHPEVTVTIAQLGHPSVMVLGDVKTPGRYQLPSGAHLSNAIAAAGGLGEVNGLYPAARVSDAQGNVREISLDSLLRRGKMSLDIPLSNGSVVYIPSPIHFSLDVMGAVDRPGKIQLSQGDRLSMAIAKAGDSVKSQADLSHIYLTRTEPNGLKKTYEIDLYRALQSGDSKYDVQMQKGDVVYVPQMQKRSGLFNGILAVLHGLLTGSAGGY